MRIRNITTPSELRISLQHFGIKNGHFVKQSDGTSLVYNQEHCDHCNKPCQGANPIIYEKGTDPAMFSVMLTEDKYEAPEFDVTEEGDAVCPDCAAKAAAV